MVQNKGLIFKNPPTDWPIEGKDLTIEDRPFDLDTEPPENGLVVKNYYASFDPYQRGLLQAPQAAHYSPLFQLGKPITSAAIAKVLKSNNSTFKEGDIIYATIPTEEYSVLSGGDLAGSGIRKLDNPHNLDLKLYLGALGMPGLTAYSSLYEIGKPKEGETIFISAASGAVGQIVGQLAKHEGLKVIGSVGSDDKLGFIKNELGFKEGFNYKKERPVKALQRLAPKGIDIYYDNVGGEQLEAAIGAMNNFGRIIACGMVSQYNITDPEKKYGVKNLPLVIGKRLTIRGFIVKDPDMGPKYAVEHQKNVAKWISEGTFKAQQSVTVGIDNAIKGFLGMLRGDNFGKAVLTIDELK